MCPDNPPSFPHLIPALGKSHNYRQRKKGNTKLMMGCLFNPGLHHCRILWLQRGQKPRGYSHGFSKASNRTGRKCQEYPRAHSCLPVAQPLEKGKRKRLLQLPHSLSPPPTIALHLPSSSKWFHVTPIQKAPCSVHSTGNHAKLPSPQASSPEKLVSW